MTTYSKLNIVYRLQKWMDSVPGQTFLNYAYSWGASIVILGTLFKLTHLPGANFMLFLGMGTEVVVFFISAFDRPFDKTAIGRDLPTHVQEDEEGAVMAGSVPAASQKGSFEGAEGLLSDGGRTPLAGQNGSFGTIIVTQSAAGGAPQQPSAGQSQQPSAAQQQQPADSAQPSAAVQPQGVMAVAGASPELAEAQKSYVEELKKLTETLQKVSEQSQRLTRDSEEMETLNRTLTGICRVYEMQLKGASQQIGTIDQINDQSKRMASLIEQLNSIYSRMIEAMTVNMRSAAQGGPAAV